MDKSIALRNLVSIKDILTELDLRYFLTDGTLLGLIRDSNFIDFDEDTDIGVFFEDFTDEKLNRFTKAMADKGFVDLIEFGDYVNNFQMSFKRNGVKTDIFFYRPFEDKMIFHAFRGSEVITYFYRKELVEDLMQIGFIGNSFHIPANYQEFLIAKYGQNWRVEDRSWDWAYSPFNILNPKPIVFTVGCFDCLHEGHLNLFEAMCKEIGLSDYNNPLFWVFIHDDYSILQNKRRLPVQTLVHRSRNLEIVKVGNSVEVNDADPTRELIKFVARNAGRKMIFMRGDDLLDFPGRSCLESAGVEIKFINYTQGVSASLIREQLK